MIKAIRDKFNNSFSEEKYQTFLHDFNSSYNFPIKFRVAETPIFVAATVKKKLIQASNEIIDFIVRDDFKKLYDEFKSCKKV